MSKAIQKTGVSDAVETALMQNDLSKLSLEQRNEYYHSVCKSLGLNPLTQPFGYIKLNGKLTLYAKKDCTDQLRKIHGISLKVVDKNETKGIYQVTVEAATKDGRVDSDIGSVNIQSLRGDAFANATMKAVTKAKRRVTLSICGMGFPDESELESIPPGAKEVESQAAPSPTKALEQKPTADQLKHLVDVAKQNGWNAHQVNDIVFKRYQLQNFRALKNLDQFAEILDVIKNETHQVVSQTMGAAEIENDVPQFDTSSVSASLPNPSTMAKSQGKLALDGAHQIK